MAIDRLLGLDAENAPTQLDPDAALGGITSPTPPASSRQVWIDQGLVPPTTPVLPHRRIGRWNTNGQVEFVSPARVYVDLEAAVAPNPSAQPFWVDSTEIAPVDVTAPTVTAFVVPATSPSRVVPITTFTWADDVAVIAWMVTTSSTQPAANDSRWSDAPVLSVDTGGDGTFEIYAWVKDIAGRVSSVGASTHDGCVVATVIDNLDLFDDSAISPAFWQVITYGDGMAIESNNFDNHFAPELGITVQNANDAAGVFFKTTLLKNQNWTIELDLHTSLGTIHNPDYAVVIVQSPALPDYTNPPYDATRAAFLYIPDGGQGTWGVQAGPTSDTWDGAAYVDGATRRFKVQSTTTQIRAQLLDSDGSTVLADTGWVDWSAVTSSNDPFYLILGKYLRFGITRGDISFTRFHHTVP